MKCTCCEMLYINGVVCHETGCPKLCVVKCSTCGMEIPKGEECNCMACDHSEHENGICIYCGEEVDWVDRVFSDDMER